MSKPREILIRPSELDDLPQCVEILKYWTLESNWALIEWPLSLVDMTELYRKMKTRGLPFFVACWADQQESVLGFMYAVPESSRLIRIPGVMTNSIFIKPGLRGLKLFERLLFPYVKVLLTSPAFRGTLSDTNAGNTHIHHKHSAGYAIGKMPPIVMNGIGIKRGEWINQGLEFFPRSYFEAGIEIYEELMNVKL